LTFDGVYKSVIDNKDILEGRDVIMFVMGKYIGGNNDFDEGRHYQESYCTLEDLEGLKLGYHSWSHKDLTKLSDEELDEEVKPIFPTEHFAYPYGLFDERVINAVRKYYKYGYSVDQGDNSDYQITRRYL
jgi:peptidoglycan/xylan/chitin deacetylase (PgdA/CDA1 family)